MNEKSSDAQLSTRRSLLGSLALLMLSSLEMGLLPGFKLGKAFSKKDNHSVVLSYILPLGMGLETFYSTQATWINAKGVTDLIEEMVRAGRIARFSPTEQAAQIGTRRRVSFKIDFPDQAAFDQFRSEIMSRDLINVEQRIQLGIEVEIQRG